MTKFNNLRESFKSITNPEKKKKSDSEFEIFESLSKFGRILTYFLSANAYRLVVAPSKKQTGDDELTKEEGTLIRSNLLAGGIESKFVN